MKTSAALLQFWASVRAKNRGPPLPMVEVSSRSIELDVLVNGARTLGLEVFRFAGADGPLEPFTIQIRQGDLLLKRARTTTSIAHDSPSAERSLSAYCGMIVTRAAPHEPVSGGVWCGASMALRALRPYATKIDALCINNNPMLQNSPSWVMSCSRAYLLPLPRVIDSNAVPNPFTGPLQARVGRLQHLRMEIEQFLAHGVVEEGDRLEACADSILVFATATLDTLACYLAFEHCPQNPKLLRSSFEGKENAVAVRHLQGFGGAPPEPHRTMLFAAIAQVYQLRNLVAHRAPSSVSTFHVTAGMVGLRNRYYDDPSKPAFRKHVRQSARGARQYDGRTQPLIALNMTLIPEKDRPTEASLGPLAETLAAVGAPMFLIIDKDDAFIDPLALAEALTLLTSCLAREAIWARHRRYGGTVETRDQVAVRCELPGDRDGFHLAFSAVGALVGWYPEPSRALLWG